MPRIISAPHAFVRAAAPHHQHNRADIQRRIVELEQRRREFVTALEDVIADLAAVDRVIAVLRANLALIAGRES